MRQFPCCCCRSGSRLLARVRSLPVGLVCLVFTSGRRARRGAPGRACPQRRRCLPGGSPPEIGSFPSFSPPPSLCICPFQTHPPLARARGAELVAASALPVVLAVPRKADAAGVVAASGGKAKAVVTYSPGQVRPVFWGEGGGGGADCGAAPRGLHPVTPPKSSRAEPTNDSLRSWPRWCPRPQRWPRPTRPRSPSRRPWARRPWRSSRGGRRQGPTCTRPRRCGGLILCDAAARPIPSPLSPLSLTRNLIVLTNLPHVQGGSLTVIRGPTFTPEHKAAVVA